MFGARDAAKDGVVFRHLTKPLAMDSPVQMTNLAIFDLGRRCGPRCQHSRPESIAGQLFSLCASVPASRT